MKLFFKLMLILLPLFAIVTLFATLNNQQISFVEYITRITSVDYKFVNDAKKALDVLIDNFDGDTFISNRFDDPLSNMINGIAAVLSAIAIPVVFVYFLGCCLIAMFGTAFAILPL